LRCSGHHPASIAGSQTGVIDVPSKTPLFNRSDTLLGVCEGLGTDLGINPNYLRIAFGVGLMWNPVIVVAAYLALGVAVYVARALYPAYVVADQGETASEATPNNDDNRAPDRLAA
jgi:phage shock protein C